MIQAIELFTEVCTAAIPYALAFYVGNLIVNTFFRMAFGGKVEFR